MESNGLMATVRFAWRNWSLVDLLHLKYIIFTYESGVHRTLAGTGPPEGGCGIPGGRPDRAARRCFANVGKRLVKTPKVYFADVGTLCYLAGLRDPEHAAAGPMGGAILETAVLSEIVRTLTHRGMDPQVHFWRTRAGTEVDFIIDTATGPVPIEVKLSATPRPAMAAAIGTFQRDMKGTARPGYLVHPGDVRLPLGPSAVAVPFASL